MLLYAWMLFVEKAPQRYDVGMRIMTFGRLDRIKDAIAETVCPGEAILDIGCGTGTLAVRCLRRGATVTGLDSSAFMLEEARKNASAAGLDGGLRLVKDSATQLQKHFADGSFDTVVATVSLGEFPKSYLEFIFKHCHRILRSGGRLIIADELQPDTRMARFFYNAAMGIAWIPQFLVVRRVAYPIRGLPELLAGAGFQLEERRRYSLSKLQLLLARRS